MIVVHYNKKPIYITAANGNPWQSVINNVKTTAYKQVLSSLMFTLQPNNIAAIRAITPEGKDLGSASELTDHQKKYLTYDKWQLRIVQVPAGRVIPYGQPGATPITTTQARREWYWMGREIGSRGKEDPGGYSENSPRGRGKEDQPKGGKGGAGEDAEPVSAEFVSAEGWAIRSNAPMLSINYPDREFLSLQTDPYIQKTDRIVDKRNKRDKQQDKDTIRGGAKGLNKKGKIDDWSKGHKLPKASKKKVKLRDPEGFFPSDKARLGYIEQDLFIHSDLASNQGYQTKKKAKKNQKQQDGQDAPHRWRFKFHYNPVEITVSQNYSEDMDPLFVKKDPATSIQSGSYVSFNMYLNRTEEMQILNHDGSWRQGFGGRSNIDDGYAQWAWKNKLPREVRKEIRTKGTLYDLEYLFRVCNGDPIEGMWKGDSADYGVLFGQPLRLYFTNVKHNGLPVGMAYYGIIKSINVTHKMFSADMVPCLSVVEIGFSRIPDTAALSADNLGKAYAT